MNDYMPSVMQAARFIDAQAIPGRAKWRRTDDLAGNGDYSLYHGAAGIALFQLELHTATGEPERLAHAVAAGEEIVAFIDRVEKLPVGIFTGWPGYAFALNELAKAAGRSDFAAAAARCLDRLRSQATEFGDALGWIEQAPFADITGFSGLREVYDQSVGAAGAGLVLLYAHREGLHPRALEWAVATGNRLLEVSESDPAGLRWKMMNDMPFPFTAPNYAHGGAGVGFFLAELYKATKDSRYLDAAIAAASYLESRAKPFGDGCLIPHTEDARDPIFYLGVCHGPAGTARLFLSLHDVTGDEKWMKATHALTAGLLHTGAPETRSDGFWRNHGQCCGDAGVGEFAVMMARHTGDEAYLDLARRCAAVILADSELDEGCRKWVQAEHRARPEFLEAQTGYMQGAAGIGSFLLHLGSTIEGRPVKVLLPDWPTALTNGAGSTL